MKQSIIYLLFVLTCTHFASANGVVVNAQLDSTSFVMGDQVNVQIQISKPVNEVLQLPQFADTIVQGVDIVYVSRIDTVLTNTTQQLTYHICITSFEPGNYRIPALYFSTESQTYQTSALPFEVRALNVNPDTDTLSDIKSIMEVPFSWKMLFMWVGIALLVLALVAGIVFVLVKYVFKKKIPVLQTVKEVHIPPHIVAIEKLNKIKEEKLGQTDNVKEYYSQLSDVLREYLEARFQISAPEMTTDEIMQMVVHTPDLLVVKDTLHTLLHLSDVVKFAKYIPLQSDNDVSMVNSYFIVEKTKEEIEPVVHNETKKVE
ncbi:MAG: hypothetical protein KA397_00155 [Paludibacteraceae bacterium]|nr:hypothetical protein [Paludibacteraceae bacterium]MBP6284470.1 hypothetical protein [Paludibacteraceae bacterium]